MNKIVSSIDKLLAFPAETVMRELAKNAKFHFRAPAYERLWKEEIIGQISDGAWENSSGNSWIFWANIPTVVDGKTWVEGWAQGIRKSFRMVHDLMPVVSDRMLETIQKDEPDADERHLKSILWEIEKALRFPIPAGSLPKSLQRQISPPDSQTPSDEVIDIEDFVSKVSQSITDEGEIDQGKLMFVFPSPKTFSENEAKLIHAKVVEVLGPVRAKISWSQVHQALTITEGEYYDKETAVEEGKRVINSLKSIKKDIPILNRMQVWFYPDSGEGNTVKIFESNI